MKRFRSILLAASSVFCVLAALGASRPHYGGTLRVVMREAPQNLEPNNAGTSPSLVGLFAETLVALDDRGLPVPLLATNWQAEGGSQRWRFSLRSGVNFHDGTTLDTGSVIASLRASNPEWKVLAEGESVIIETSAPDPDVPAELALSRNSIVKRGNGKLVGTGPFAISEWFPGKHLTVTANEQCWAGRPYLDSIEVEFGKNDRDQMMALELGKAEVAEVAAENIHRAEAENHAVKSTEPYELIALIFSNESRPDDETHARTALANGVDRTSLNDVVLQAGGDPSAALLPEWASGYAFLFEEEINADIAQLRRNPLKSKISWNLGFDSADSVSRVIAQRIVLNARDVGITLQTNASTPPDVRLVRVPLASSDPHVALIELAKALQLPSPKFNDATITGLYAAEKSMLQSHRVVPLLHARNAAALGARVRDWNMSSDGTWRLSNVWLSPEKP